MDNKDYANKILRIIGNVQVIDDNIYKLAYDTYVRLGGTETLPTLDTIYKELKAAIELYDNTPGLTITENGTYTLFGKTIDVSIGSEPISYTCLKFTSTGNSIIALSTATNPDMKYSLDNGSTWILWDYSNINLLDGETVLFKGNNPNGISNSTKYNQFIMTGSLAASGNIMSLIDDGACETLIIPNSFCFANLFNGCTALNSAIIELPATTLTQGCYLNMFYGCSNITTGPTILPATTLAYSCYLTMFSRCSSLTSAPELPAPTLIISCYYYMFYRCSNLNYIKCLATDIQDVTCTTFWVDGVSSTGTFVKDANMTDWATGKTGIPRNWTVQNA